MSSETRILWNIDFIGLIIFLVDHSFFFLESLQRGLLLLLENQSSVFILIDTRTCMFWCVEFKDIALQRLKVVACGFVL